MACDEIRNCSTVKNLYNVNNFFSGKESSANNYIKGHYTLGREILDPILERIRKETEKCNNLDAFNIHYSLCGGTSG